MSSGAGSRAGASAPASTMESLPEYTKILLVELIEGAPYAVVARDYYTGETTTYPIGNFVGFIPKFSKASCPAIHDSGLEGLSPHSIYDLHKHKCTEEVLQFTDGQQFPFKPVPVPLPAGFKPSIIIPVPQFTVSVYNLDGKHYVSIYTRLVQLPTKGGRRRKIKRRTVRRSR